MSAHKSSEKPYVLLAPNGARRGVKDHAYLPVTLDQITETAQACHGVGAQGLHLHIRDTQGRHSLDAGQYLETIAELRRQVPTLDIQITTEAVGLYDVQAQYDCLAGVRPGWASVSVREIARAPDLADRVYGLCAEQGTRVQHILYNAADVALLAQWRASGIVRMEQSEHLLVLGRYSAGMNSSPEDLDRLPPVDGPWMVCAFGPREHACLAMAAKKGGDVRVGFENSLTDHAGTPWADNAASVAALVETLKGIRS
ncbi:3-keto-5-aminohexanoate cleavage protein [Ruegeria lacuscaerulensis]|uniref:3-keto-5-aminohexanoate cleavage protein n=1 Tax=Ruegeria lacuscaerulensis TaxID=55218 RepID=UPI0014799D68|nr:3-keto-5-aminohexanoate cleavage protein [Ruegeria lacuscaerulensis]